MNVSHLSKIEHNFKVPDSNLNVHNKKNIKKEVPASVIYHENSEEKSIGIYNQNGKLEVKNSVLYDLHPKEMSIEDRIFPPRVTSGKNIDTYDRSKLKYIADLVKLSSAAYNAKITQIENYHKLEASDIVDMGLDPSLFNRNDGMFAVIYKNDDSDRYIVAYRGSEVPKLGIDSFKSSGFNKVLEAAKDWGNDIFQAVGLPASQYKSAKVLAQHIYKVLGNKVSFTGHSLGGGLATIASLSTGAKAYTFNSAAIADKTLKWLGLPDINEAKASNNITAFYVKGEPLASANSLIKQTINNFNPTKADIIGESYEIPVAKPADFFNPGSLHQLSYILNYLNIKIAALKNDI